MAIDPATPALAAVAADPMTAVLAAVAAEPTTAELATVATEATTAALATAAVESEPLSSVPMLLTTSFIFSHRVASVPVARTANR
ncbi:MAG: hypothetical protein P4L48_13255 [Mycobacterium sp.]|nr:hypothetical protein [Mycobacterium sp.]HKI40195.1 hypothetical protein [Mycobacterium sp.]